jgi:hypothetical protein
MTFPGFDVYPGPDLFPGEPFPVIVGGYSQPIQVALSDLVLTATDELGVDWVAEILDGWYGSPASTLQLVGKSRGPGAFAGPRQLDTRPLTVSGFVEAPSAQLLLDALNRLNTAASLDFCVLTVSESDETLSLRVQRQGAVTISRLGDTTAVWSVQLVAADPRKFAATVTDDTTLPSTSGGLILPLKLPLFLNSTVVTGLCHLSSPGNANGLVQLRIDGPCAGPIITHVGSGRSLVFGSSLVLGTGQYLLIDMEARTALENGQSSRNGWITDRGWSNFEPGDNEWAFTAASYDPAATLTVSATPAWL